MKQPTYQSALEQAVQDTFQRSFSFHYDYFTRCVQEKLHPFPLISSEDECIKMAMEQAVWAAEREDFYFI